MMNVCDQPTIELFSNTGLLEVGARLYYDQYGNSPVSGYKWISNSPVDCGIWSLNLTTGEVIANEGYQCPYCV